MKREMLVVLACELASIFSVLSETDVVLFECMVAYPLRVHGSVPPPPSPIPATSPELVVKSRAAEGQTAG